MSGLTDADRALACSVCGEFHEHNVVAVLRARVAAREAQAWDEGYEASAADLQDTAMYASDHRTPNPYREVRDA